MAGKIDGQHTEAVMGEPTALQRPYAVVHPRAVEKDDERLARLVRLAAGAGEYKAVFDFEPHHRAFPSAEAEPLEYLVQVFRIVGRTGCRRLGVECLLVLSVSP